MSKIPSAQGNKATYSIVAPNTYPARLVSFVGLGMQEQQPYQGQAKAPCFKANLGFELIGQKITATKGDEVTEFPAVLRPQYNVFPGGSRGKTFDLCAALKPGLKEVPGDLSFFKELLKAPVAVTVGTYEDKFGNTRNCVNGVSPMMAGMQVGEAETDLIFFDPYESSEENKKAYDSLFEYLRTIISEAVDAEHIPFAGMAASEEVAGEETDTDDVY
jgi:hypothetical protein